MREVLGGIHEGVVGWGHSLGTEDSGVTMLLTVEATKFGAFVVRMAGGGLSAGGTMMMGTVRAEVFGRSTCEALSWNDCA